MVDGWFRSGDLGTKDAEGFITIVDRKKDLVIRGGFNVYPREVEEALARHPAVVQVAVIGVPDPVHGEEICAVVVPDPGGVTEQELIEWSKERLGRHKYPRQVRFVEALPLGPSSRCSSGSYARPSASSTGSSATIGLSAGSQGTLSSSSAASQRIAVCSSARGSSPSSSVTAKTRSTARPCASGTSGPTRSPTVDPYAELLRAFAGQRLCVGLARLDLAARELPAPGDLRRGRALAGEHPAGRDDHRRDDHSG